MTKVELGATKAGWIGLRSLPITAADGYWLQSHQLLPVGRINDSLVSLCHIKSPNTRPCAQIEDILRVVQWSNMVLPVEDESEAELSTKYDSYASVKGALNAYMWWSWFHHSLFIIHRSRSCVGERTYQVQAIFLRFIIWKSSIVNDQQSNIMLRRHTPCAETYKYFPYVRKVIWVYNSPVFAYRIEKQIFTWR